MNKVMVAILIWTIMVGGLLAQGITVCQQIPCESKGRFIITGVKPFDGYGSTLRSLESFLNSKDDKDRIVYANVNNPDIKVWVEKVEDIGERASSSNTNIPVNFDIKIKRGDGSSYNIPINFDYRNGQSQHYYTALIYVSIWESSGTVQIGSAVIPGIYGWNKESTGISVDIGRYFGPDVSSQKYFSSYREAAVFIGMAALTKALKETKPQWPVIQHRENFWHLRSHETVKGTINIGDCFKVERYLSNPPITIFYAKVIGIDRANDRFYTEYKCPYTFSSWLDCDRPLWITPEEYESIK